MNLFGAPLAWRDVGECAESCLKEACLIEMRDLFVNTWIGCHVGYEDMTWTNPTSDLSNSNAPLDNACPSGFKYSKKDQSHIASSPCSSPYGMCCLQRNQGARGDFR